MKELTSEEKERLQVMLKKKNKKEDYELFKKVIKDASKTSS